MLVGAFNQEKKVLVGAFSVIVKTDGSFEALIENYLCFFLRQLFPFQDMETEVGASLGSMSIKEEKSAASAAVKTSGGAAGKFKKKNKEKKKKIKNF